MRKALVIVALLPISFPICATVQADGVKWGPGPATNPSGVQFAVVSGNPSNDGLYVVRLKVPAGCKTQHSHPNDENVTVISGSFNIGTDNKLDQKGHDAQHGWLLACSKRGVTLRVVDGRLGATAPCARTAGHCLRESCR